MSSFGGTMREYLDVSLDRFDGENLESTVYFLSHKHEDHMVGLASSSFAYRLHANSHIKLYCSEVTRDLLLADERFKPLAKSLAVLEIEVPCSVCVPDQTTGKTKYSVTVTTIQAGHCPGSVMFLFEGKEGTALYTGDFRLACGDVSRIESLRSGNDVKSIDSLYIDTTFCVPEAYYIPSREDSTAAVISAIESWITTSSDHLVLINYRAALGYEHLFIEIVKHFQTKIHLSDRKYKECSAVKAFPDFGTNDGSTTQIHACKWSEVKKRHSSPLPCGRSPSSSACPLHVRVITVSTMWFTQQVGMEDIVVIPRKNRPKYMRACYSFHSSYSEVRDVVMYLRPRRVFPNVIPLGHNMKQIQDRLNSFLQIASSSSRIPATPSKPRLLGRQKSPRKRNISNECSQSTDSDLIFDDSPRKPVAKKAKTTDDKPLEDGDALTLRWSASQSSEDPASQPLVNGDHKDVGPGNGSDLDSNYVGSQKSSSSAMELAASDFDLTPKKTPKKADMVSHSASQLGKNGCAKHKDHMESSLMNGSVHLESEEREGSEELFSDCNEEVKSSRDKFIPFKEGSFGSFVSYASDVDIQYSDEGTKDEDGKTDDAKLVNGMTDTHESDSNKKETNIRKTPQDPSSPPNKGIDSKASEEKKEEEVEERDVQNMEKSDKESGKVNGDVQKVIGEDEDAKDVSMAEEYVEDEDDDDIIMLDSDAEEEEDIVEEGVVATNSDDTVNEASIEEEEEEEGESKTEQRLTGEDSESDSQDVIDLTADDEEEGNGDIVKLPATPSYNDDCDGYHGDSESEADNSDTNAPNVDSDSSFTKASFEKMKKKLSSGKSRRSAAVNGYSSSDSDSDSDGETSKEHVVYKPPARYPIAGSSHYSTTRLNGFHQTLKEDEVIILDDEDPPPNVTVEEATKKDKELQGSNHTMASAEDLVSGAMEMASAAKAVASNINNSKQSPMSRFKGASSNPKAVLGSFNRELVKRTARKSTSGTRPSPKKVKIDGSGASIGSAGSGGGGDGGGEAQCVDHPKSPGSLGLLLGNAPDDKRTSKTRVNACEKSGVSLDVDESISTQNDSGKEMEELDEKDNNSKEVSPASVLR